MGKDVGVNVSKGMLVSMGVTIEIEVGEGLAVAGALGVGFNNGWDSIGVSTSTASSCFGLQDPRKINKERRHRRIMMEILICIPISLD